MTMNSIPKDAWLETVRLCEVNDEEFSLESDRGGLTYFLRAGNTDRLKIGFTKTFETRRVVLQTGNPEPLILVGLIAGPPIGEKAAHLQYAEWRLQGEWFENCDRILEDIARMGDVPTTNLIGTLKWQGFWNHPWYGYEARASA